MNNQLCRGHPLGASKPWAAAATTAFATATAQWGLEAQKVVTEDDIYRGFLPFLYPGRRVFGQVVPVLKYRTLLHQRKKQRFLSKHISHHGGAGEHNGTDMLELDCHITKDVQVVVSHDANLKRSTRISVNVSNTVSSHLTISESIQMWRKR